MSNRNEIAQWSLLIGLISAAAGLQYTVLVIALDAIEAYQLLLCILAPLVGSVIATIKKRLGSEIHIERLRIGLNDSSFWTGWLIVIQVIALIACLWLLSDGFIISGTGLLSTVTASATTMAKQALDR